MLRLLLDEHLSPTIATHLRRRLPDLVVYSLLDWQHGALLQADDATVLRAAHTQGLTLVTFDQRTIRPLLKAWSEQGIAHSGVIFISSHTFAPNALGAIVQALAELYHAYAAEEWGDRVQYVSRELG